jgi:nucleolar protein 9
MPKENKHARGRRGAEGKRKRTDERDEEHHAKRRKSADPEEIQFTGTDNAEVFEDGAHAPGGTERPFFGLLDDEEQEYFRRADELLELNDFPSPEERSLFLANVYKEAEGKELKIANSQSCSRLMERLILLSTPDQKKKLFEKFSGHFMHLIQHRFASHCCETLFIESAPLVTQELTGDMPESKENEQGVEGEEGVYVSMENLFLYTLNELEGQMGFLLTDRFASHALRVLLVVLSGQPLAKSSTRSLLQSKKKEKISITGLEASNTELSLDKRAVPESFEFAINKIISDTVAGLDTSFIHVLATHPTGNPTLQLLLELELTRQDKQKKASPETPSIVQKLLPDDMAAEGSKSASFINGLMYEPIGSRLLETIVTFAPGKLFKQIYRATFKERIGSLARNEIASYVVIKVLERLSKQDLEEAVGSILPQIPGLIERSRTIIIKTLLERCNVRKSNESIKLLTTAIDEAYGSDPKTLLYKMTGTTPESLAQAALPHPEVSKTARPLPFSIHGSLLAQTMLSIPGPSTLLLQTAILTIPTTTLVHLACITTTSHILQAALIPSPTDLSFRRKLVNSFLLSPPNSPDSSVPVSPEQQPNPILLLATSKPGSHVLDALYTGTTSLMNLKERIATILQSHEAQLRDDFVGRVVLRNWMVELFGRRRGEWVKRVREGEEESKPFMGEGHGQGTEGAGVKGNGVSVAQQRRMNGKGGKGGMGKTGIELAREKFAAGQVKKGMKRNGKATGANAI